MSQTLPSAKTSLPAAEVVFDSDPAVSAGKRRVGDRRGDKGRDDNRDRTSATKLPP
jgi:hypothetical protein